MFLWYGTSIKKQLRVEVGRSLKCYFSFEETNSLIIMKKSLQFQSKLNIFICRCITSLSQYSLVPRALLECKCLQLVLKLYYYRILTYLSILKLKWNQSSPFDSEPILQLALYNIREAVSYMVPEELQLIWYTINVLKYHLSSHSDFSYIKLIFAS